MSRTRPSPRLLLLPLLAATALLGVACGEEEAPEVAISGERPSTSTTAAGGDADPTEFCDALAASQAAEGGDGGGDGAGAGNGDTDVAEVLAELEALAELAPAELVDDFEVMAGAFEQLEGLDEDDPESLEAIFEVVFDEEMLSATLALEAYAEEECGLELEGLDPTTSGGGGDTGSGGGDTGSGAGPEHDPDDPDVHLEEVGAVEDAHEGESWADKLDSTFINMGHEVTVSADPSAGLTEDEALDACRALVEALRPGNAELTVAVQSGETVLASAPEGGDCAAG